MTNPIHGHSPHPEGTMFGYDESVHEYRVPTVKPEGGLVTVTGLSIPEHDYIIPVYDTTTDTFTYKNGGVSGNTVATVIVTYTDGTKTIMSSIART